MHVYIYIQREREREKEWGAENLANKESYETCFSTEFQHT